jgi:hypothetical protein
LPKAERASLAEWIAAVNEHGGFGTSRGAVSYSPGDVAMTLARSADRSAASG